MRLIPFCSAKFGVSRTFWKKESSRKRPEECRQSIFTKLDKVKHQVYVFDQRSLEQGLFSFTLLEHSTHFALVLSNTLEFRGLSKSLS